MYFTDFFFNICLQFVYSGCLFKRDSRKRYGYTDARTGKWGNVLNKGASKGLNYLPLRRTTLIQDFIAKGSCISLITSETLFVNQRSFKCIFVNLPVTKSR